MTERKDIYLDNFEQLCPLVKIGWIPLYPTRSSPQNINILLTKEFSEFQDKEAEGAASDAVAMTCSNCEYAHSSPLTNTVCFSNQGIPENSAIAVVYVSMKGIEV